MECLRSGERVAMYEMLDRRISNGGVFRMVIIDEDAVTCWQLLCYDLTKVNVEIESVRAVPAKWLLPSLLNFRCKWRG